MGLGPIIEDPDELKIGNNGKRHLMVNELKNDGVIEKAMFSLRLGMYFFGDDNQ